MAIIIATLVCQTTKNEAGYQNSQIPIKAEVLLKFYFAVVLNCANGNKMQVWSLSVPELSMGWVDPWVELGRGSKNFHKFFRRYWKIQSVSAVCSKVEAIELIRWGLRAGLLVSCDCESNAYAKLT